MPASFAHGPLASAPDWTSLGILLAIVGSFLLGNAILFRPPRVLVEELFALRRRRLSAVREYVFHRVQVGVGFLYLTGGFALQLLGRYQPLDPAAPRSFPSLWAGALAVLTLALLVSGWFYASHSFRVTLRAHFRSNPPDLENDRELARELGELFGVAPDPEDTVESYAARLRSSLRLAPPGRRGVATAPDDAEDPFEERPARAREAPNPGHPWRRRRPAHVRSRARAGRSASSCSRSAMP